MPRPPEWWPAAPPAVGTCSSFALSSTQQLHVLVIQSRLRPPNGGLPLEKLGQSHHRDAEENEEQEHRVGLSAVERLRRQRDDVADPVGGREEFADEQADQAAG